MFYTLPTLATDKPPPFVTYVFVVTAVFNVGVDVIFWFRMYAVPR